MFEALRNCLFGSELSVDSYITQIEQGTNQMTIRAMPINAEQTARMVAALKGNNSLVTLTLDGNGLYDTLLQTLADGIKDTKQLVSLTLTNQPYTEEGIIALLEAIKGVRSIQIVTLNEALLTEEGAKKLLEILKQKSPNLTVTGYKIDGSVPYDLRQKIEGFNPTEKEAPNSLFKTEEDPTAARKLGEDSPPRKIGRD